MISLLFLKKFLSDCLVMAMDKLDLDRIELDNLIFLNVKKQIKDFWNFD